MVLFLISKLNYIYLLREKGLYIVSVNYFYTNVQLELSIV
jgi:hypothetical protein